MHYYEVAILGHRLKPLTYSQATPLQNGQLVTVNIRNSQKTGVVLAEVEQPVFKCLTIVSTIQSHFSPNQIQLAKFISMYYVCEIGETLSIFEPFENLEQQLSEYNQNSCFNLSEEQQQAYKFCQQRKISLLFGDTGSGKTEIYIKIIEKHLVESGNALFLLPEISLTPQIELRLKKIFGSLVGIWHSKQSKKAKETVLNGIKNGSIRVILGARSALFLPIPNLSIIIVDEEHDDAFKSEQRPRYNARDLAIYISQKFNIQVVLGSATPSLATYNNIESYRLYGGFFNSSKTWYFDENGDGLSEVVISNIIKSVHTKHSQSIIFIPTRANFKYVICNNCFKNIECPYCSVSMSLHADEKRLKCHYCNFSQFIPAECPHCNIGTLGFKRIGTSEVTSILKELFPKNNIKKFDRDEITTERKLKETLEEFNRGNIDILVGTQMLSKGHDYHNVDTAVILGMDGLLAQNDFRANEKAISLLIQIAGRAGRKKEATVIVQSKNKEFFERYINNYETFLKEELKKRLDLYPPHKRLARLIFTSLNKNRAKEKMNAALAKIDHTKIEVVGFGEATINKIGGKYRFDILLRGTDAKQLLNSVYMLDLVDFEVDMDPINFT